MTGTHKTDGIFDKIMLENIAIVEVNGLKIHKLSVHKWIWQVNRFQKKHAAIGHFLTNYSLDHPI